MKTCSQILWTDEGEPTSCGKPGKTESPTGSRCAEHPYVKPIGARFRPPKKDSNG